MFEPHDYDDFPTDEELDAESVAHVESMDYGYLDTYEPYEPSPYDGTYSEM